MLKQSRRIKKTCMIISGVKEGGHDCRSGKASKKTLYYCSGVGGGIDLDSESSSLQDKTVSKARTKKFLSMRTDYVVCFRQQQPTRPLDALDGELFGSQLSSLCDQVENVSSLV